MIVERYSHVMHLVSNVRVQLAEGRDCFEALMRPPSRRDTVGPPKVRAMEIIDELNWTAAAPTRRRADTVDFTRNMDLCITIRTMPPGRRALSIQAGRGSWPIRILDRGYEETLNKAAGMMKAVRSAARGFELSESISCSSRGAERSASRCRYRSARNDREEEQCTFMIDDYDSFTYNLVQYLGQLGCDVAVHRNDEITVEEIEAMAPEAIFLSPGPCTPRRRGSPSR